ncbi:DUF4197 domain-containing protein [Hymenobacter properus]|uniref:DUF4197 domain-containing protein n=1 Tax=Hymenobacter properus TaxID=2791026 RepID=A0A931FKU3_9BACT|nr:DUF4197 domain-containing protein [Hymenobacter properus]MBF9140069.1 DUF4197 domain-containing protein [Hymenobacter properus]MBR7718876.1 DUF4197 domain-containing protein [Microvirga sp. SRT04]
MFTRIAGPLLVVGLLAASSAQAQTKTTTKKTTTTKTTTQTAAQKAAAAKAAAAKAAADKAAAAKAAAEKAAADKAAAAAAAKPLTEAEASAGVKEALNKGIIKAVQFASEPDGYNANDDIHIPTPPDLDLVKGTIGRLPGMTKLFETFETQLNRAAEAAAPKAKDIFLNALTNMSFTDAITLVTSSQTDAATQFLRKSTQAQLVSAFHPDIEAAIDQVGAGRAYATITNTYNKIPLQQPVTLSLADYTTQKAVDGLFILLANEEAKIRKNPAARTSDILKSVFGRK